MDVDESAGSLAPADFCERTGSSLSDIADGPEIGESECPEDNVESLEEGHEEGEEDDVEIAGDEERGGFDDGDGEDDCGDGEEENEEQNAAEYEKDYGCEAEVFGVVVNVGIVCFGVGAFGDVFEAVGLAEGEIGEGENAEEDEEDYDPDKDSGEVADE